MLRHKLKPNRVYAIALVPIAVAIWLWTLDYANVSKVASILTVGSLIFAPLWYFIKKNRDETEARKRAAGNLASELEDTLYALNPKNHNDLFQTKTQDGSAYFINRIFNHDFYDSLISSGQINFVDRHLQQPVQDVYHHIRDHNAYLLKIRDIEEGADSDVSELTDRYYQMLETIERKLIADIPKAMEKLKAVS